MPLALDSANKASWELKRRAKASLQKAKSMKDTVGAPGYAESLVGYIGVTG